MATTNKPDAVETGQDPPHATGTPTAPGTAASGQHGPRDGASTAAAPTRLSPQREAEIAAWVEEMGQRKDIRYYGAHQMLTELLAELAAVRAEHNQARAELAKYVGVEPTFAEEMAYLSRCLDAVLDVCDKTEKQAGRWEQPLPVPEWVAEVRKAAEGIIERTSYPPAMPWARLMDADDLECLLADLADAASGDDDLTTLDEVEAAIGRWRVIAEAQHAHNTAPGPEAGEER